MKRVAVWLSMIVCFFGTCQLYAAPSKCTPVGRAIVFLFRFAREHNWPRWVILTLVVVGLLVSVGGIAEYFSDKKKKQLVKNHYEKGTT